jgi:hypothetical protein
MTAADAPRVTTPSPTGLYWNRHGNAACAAHTPPEGSRDWVSGRWGPMPTDAVRDYAAVSHVPTCAVCGKRAEQVS